MDIYRAASGGGWPTEGCQKESSQLLTALLTTPFAARLGPGLRCDPQRGPGASGPSEPVPSLRTVQTAPVVHRPCRQRLLLAWIRARGAAICTARPDGLDSEGPQAPGSFWGVRVQKRGRGGLSTVAPKPASLPFDARLLTTPSVACCRPYA